MTRLHKDVWAHQSEQRPLAQFLNYQFLVFAGNIALSKNSLNFYSILLFVNLYWIEVLYQTLSYQRNSNGSNANCHATASSF